MAGALSPLVGGEIAGAEHRPVAVPVPNEGIDHLAGGVEAGWAGPRSFEQLVDRSKLLPDLRGQRQHGLFDVTEVLIEGRRRGPDLASDVDDAQVAYAVAFEQPGGRVEQSAPGGGPPLAEWPAVERDRGFGRRRR